MDTDGESRKRKAERAEDDDSDDDDADMDTSAAEEASSEEDLRFVDDLSLKELKELCDDHAVSIVGVVEKPEIVRLLKEKLEKDLQEGIPVRKRKGGQRRDCPYLDTINRTLLDFDFEKVCSVTLLNLNVYACLVCGKYFQGRARSSPAYLHSLQANHHVFINLTDEKVYCLPDGYEVVDFSLHDIKVALHPRFAPDQIAHLDKDTKTSQALDGTEYMPGVVGLNNVTHTDYVNAVVQSLARVSPLRDFFMREENYLTKTQDLLVVKFGELVRKMYNPNNFKIQVSPHEFLQALSEASDKKFKIGTLSDPLELMQFFLNHVHIALGGTKKPGSSIIHKVFQGEVEVTEMESSAKGEEKQLSQTLNPFLYLTLDVPPPPLFKNEAERNIIPQVPIFQLLAKFDGFTPTHDVRTGHQKRFKLTKLPPYLIVHIKRFTKNNWFVEKNPTIVNFPVKSLDLKDYVKDLSKVKGSTKYNLLANIVHEGEANKGSYEAHILHKPTDQWYEMQDLSVKKILPQLIALSESYIQVYEQQPK